MYTEDDGGETFDTLKDVTPTESREEVMARKRAQIEQMKQEQAARESEAQSEAIEEMVQGELIEESELEY